MIIAPKLYPATFIERVNRYLAIVNLNGKEIEAFIPNPGRMKELLIKDVSVSLRKAKNQNRKTQYDLILVYHNEEWVCIDSLLPNRFLFYLLSDKKLEEFTKYPEIKKEVTFQNSRFDFFLSGNGKGCFIEAKSCSLVEDEIALFPDAPTQRGTKHLNELMNAIDEGYSACVVIVIQRKKVKYFKPNEKTDPDFAPAMKKAHLKGVRIIALSIEIIGNQILFNKRVEVGL